MLDTKSREQLHECLTRAGATFKGQSACTCPFHRDRNPSAGIYQSENGAWRFKCQVCGDNLDIIGVEAKLTGKTAEEILKEQAVGAEPKAVLTEADIRARYVKPAYRYLHEYHDEAGEITHFVACKYDGESKRFIQMKRHGFNFTMSNNGKRPLFRIPQIAKEETILFVEGEKCVLALEWCGITCGTTCMGGAQSVAKADLAICKGKRIVIWPDNDEAGRKYASDLKQSLEAMECKVGMIDIGEMMMGQAQDVADFIARYKEDGRTKEEIKEEILAAMSAVKAAGYFEQFKAGRLADLASGAMRSLDIGWGCLANTKWLIGGSITIVCASPGIGKTWFVHDLAFRAMRAGIKVADIQLEEDKEYHVSRIVAAHKGIPINDPDNITEEELEEVHKHKDFIDEVSKILFIPEYNKCSFSDIAALVEEKAKSGYSLIIIDSISVIVKGKDGFEQDQKFVNTVKETARKYKTRIVLVTHPKTAMSKNHDMDSLAGGAAYQRLCQTVFWISEPKQGSSLMIQPSISESPSYGYADRLITCLKGRNITEHLPSKSFAFAFRNSQFHEQGFAIMPT